MRLLLVLILGLGLVSCKSKDEQLEAAEGATKFLVDKKAKAIKGIGEGLKGKGKEGVEALTEGVGEVVKGAAKGFDSSLSKVKITGSDALTAKGVQAVRASRRPNEKGKKVITTYLVFDKDFDGKLQLKALDGDGTEVGRALGELKKSAGEAVYLDFGFDERTPIMTVESFQLNAL